MCAIVAPPPSLASTGHRYTWNDSSSFSYAIFVQHELDCGRKNCGGLVIDLSCFVGTILWRILRSAYFPELPLFHHEKSPITEYFNKQSTVRDPVALQFSILRWHLRSLSFVPSRTVVGVSQVHRVVISSNHVACLHFFFLQNKTLENNYRKGHDSLPFWRYWPERSFLMVGVDVVEWCRSIEG